MLVGLPEAAVKESTHRVERAIVNSGFQRPQNRVVINLAPADLPKEAASFDLPIALGILAGSGQIAADRLAQYAVVGELALDGTTRPTTRCAVDGHGRRRTGGTARAARAQPQRRRGGRSRRRRDHPRRQPGPGRGFLTGEIEIEPQPSRLDELFRTLSSYEVDFADVRGQEMAKRALIVAASRRAQHSDARAARLGQDHAGQADADDPARPDGRSNRSKPRGSTAPWAA